MSDAVEQYLSVGFVPDLKQAENYLDRLLDGPDAGHDDPIALLTALLEESLPGSPDVVIPLSGGNDSRGILGAVLRFLPPGSITCLTVGPTFQTDWRFADAACRRNGLRHERVDPNDFVWDLEELVEIARTHTVEGGGLPTIDALFMFVQLARRIRPETPVLSGHFGGAIGGGHLHPESPTDNAEVTVRRFIDDNTAARNGSRLHSLREILFRYIERNEHRLRPFQGLTLYDLLDFGFRQGRVRPTVVSPFANCLTPYEDSRWVRFWLRRPFSDRLRKRLYRGSLMAAFPTVFLEGERMPSPPAANRALELQAWLARGDLRVNESMSNTFLAAAESFDRRGLTPIKFLPQAERLTTTSPSDALYSRIRWVLSAEVHLRAGLL